MKAKSDKGEDTIEFVYTVEFTYSGFAYSGISLIVVKVIDPRMHPSIQLSSHIVVFAYSGQNRPVPHLPL